MTRLDRDGGRWRVRTEHDSQLFDHVVLALDISGAQRLLGASEMLCSPD